MIPILVCPYRYIRESIDIVLSSLVNVYFSGPFYEYGLQLHNYVAVCTNANALSVFEYHKVGVNG